MQIARVFFYRDMRQLKTENGSQKVEKEQIIRRKYEKSKGKCIHKVDTGYAKPQI